MTKDILVKEICKLEKTLLKEINKLEPTGTSDYKPCYREGQPMYTGESYLLKQDMNDLLWYKVLLETKISEVKAEQ